MSRAVQVQIAKTGIITGDVSAVRAIIYQILEDTRFRGISAVYGPNPKPKPGKEPGKPYHVTAAGGTDSKGVQTAEFVAAKLVNNDNINIYCVDSGRRQTRSLKVPLIQSIEVYTGRRLPDPTEVDPNHTKAEKFKVPVLCVRVV
jgi:hypothetical protein